MNTNEYILGIHCGHDATAVLMVDGEIIEAMSEERLSRQKKHIGFPSLAINYIKSKYRIENFDYVAVVGVSPDDAIFTTLEENKERRKKPMITNDYLRSIGVKFGPLGALINFRDNYFEQKKKRGVGYKVKNFVEGKFPNSKISFIDHHLAHAWAAIPFLDDKSKEYVLLTLDGAGDDLSGSVCKYSEGKVERISTTPISASLGLLYCAVVDILGMQRNEHEFKVMGLAPYAKASAGEKVYEELKKLIWLDEESLTFRSKIKLNRATPYLIAQSFYKFRFDSLAYGIQKLTEQLTQALVAAAIKKTGIRRVALGGGVFMNVKANQYIREMAEVESLTVIPSCGDESLAVGAVVSLYSQLNNGDISKLKSLTNLYLGSSYTDTEIKDIIDTSKYVKEFTIEYFDPKDKTITIEQKVAQLLASNNVVGRFKGRSEWGARALGNRSILANPSSRENVKLINEMIKGRDFWMPFATSMLYERRADYLVEAESYKASFMAITFETKVEAHKNLIAALHPYDLTSRPQMVEKDINPEYHSLVSHFDSLTGIGGVLNTSFNLHGEPNVENPEDALRTFALSGLPYLAIGNYLLSK